MDEAEHILIEILYSTLNDVKNNESINDRITPNMLLSVFRLAQTHDLAHVVSDFVYRNKLAINQEVQSQLQREKLISVYRNEQMKYSFSEICDIFDKKGISYVPLKGAVIRPYYPYESMRTSCDIDILIHEYDMDTAINCLKSKGYRCGDRNYHDMSLYSPGNIHLELHFSIQENMDNLDAVLKDAWEYVVPTNTSQYTFSKEFFAFHIFAHMAYHFLSGGCGIRSLLDIWVMEHKMKISYLCAKELLQKAGIYQFAVEVSKISECCFTNDELDAFSGSVLKYIFQGGVYGSAENKFAVNKSKIGSSAGYVAKRIFLPYEYMVLTFPCLKKNPYLLPFCWVVRGIKAIFGGKSKQIISEMSCINNMSDEKLKEVSTICSQLGLLKKQ